MAAIAMLLVSSIMMVSSTYAWFTLSTAPEVTGIQTAVGANGNLEIALLPKDGLTSSITTAVGDSNLAIEAKNVTWGNLVDLSESSIYGLDGITLYPAAINYTGESADAEVEGIGATFLKTPQYGSDGRVAQLAANTSTGYFNATKGDFYPNSDMGVRGIGTASGMTPRQLAYRNAVSAANTATASAKSTASQSLNNNGSDLANIVIKKATSDNPTFTQADISALLTIVNDLLGTESKTGALEYIDRAYMNYILAAAASAAAGEGATADQAYVQVEEAMEVENATAQSVLDSLPSGVTVDSLSTAIGKLEATKNAVNTAKGELEALEGESITWAQLSIPLEKLAKYDAMLVNGIAAKDIMTGDNMSNLVNSVASGGLKVTMATGGGVYADIADHCGDYTAQVLIAEVSYGGLTLKNTPARMETKTTAKYLANISTVVTGFGAPASGNTTDMPITDMYGYIIDLAFRTNAADSNLLLQQEAIDRIYSDNANDATMGHGSNMTFNITAGGLTLTQLRDLMDAIRIVFFTTTTEGGNTVVKAAKLDVPQNADDMAGLLGADGYKANIILGSINGKGGFTPDPEESNVLMDLNQNQAHQLSVLVYLDGNLVGNEDVAAQAATSMSGKLNLQFASSATLVPMDYSQLHTPNTAGGSQTQTQYEQATSYTEGTTYYTRSDKYVEKEVTADTFADLKDTLYTDTNGTPADSFDENATYYVKDGYTYTEASGVTSENFGSGTYYVVKTTTTP
ncbi:MAG: hypothetical protein IJO22_07125 [Oscillospiraceae bacterium]|nr:hypothetical protein [Oscillospiraceae bacterium]